MYFCNSVLIKRENFSMSRIIWAICLLTALLMPKASATPYFGISGNRIGKPRTQIFSNIRFTDYEDDGSLFVPLDEVTKCSNGSTFCEGIETYPTYEITSILKEENKYAESFGSDVLNPIIIGNRFGEEEVVEQFCSSRVRLVYPRAGLTQENNWRYIINHNNYKQGVRVEECIQGRHLCEILSSPFGYRTECRQKYIYRQLVTIDEEGNTTKDAFQIPSCCECVRIRT